MKSRFIIPILLLGLLAVSPAAHAKPNGDNMQATNLHHAITSQSGWLNTARALTPEDLKGRIILLDFWTFCCINCMHVIPDLKYLEEKFGNDLSVIGIHSAKFKNEQDSTNIRNAILRYGIEHPVVNDFDFSIWNKFGVRAWPTFVLINPRGIIEATYSGEGNREKTERDIVALIKKYKGSINSDPLPLDLEKNKQAPTLFSFPGKIDGQSDTLFVSDTGHHRILQMATNGRIKETIGNGKEGFKDGSFKEARFRRPQGVLLDAKNNLLYIADTQNHALRLADLKAKTVTTIAGTGRQGYERKAKNAPAPATPLASPWDIAFYPDDKHIAIAMAGTHQLWSYDIEAKTVSVIAGNGRESIDDGAYPDNSLSQPSGLAVHDGKLYFVDSETSSLRVLEDGKITTLIGSGLFDFGFKDGKQGTALMQHAIGVTADKSGVYIADSYNHSIRRYDPNTGELSTFAGHGKSGLENGALKDAAFNEPNDLLRLGGMFYVADTNNHIIRVIDPEKNTVTALNTETSAMQEFDTNLPNLMPVHEQTVAPDKPIPVMLGLQPGWKINHEAPSYFSLFDMSSGKPVGLTGYDLGQIEAGEVSVYPMQAGQTFRLQGTLYYCEEAEGSQCLIKSFDVTVKAKTGGAEELLLKLN